jgi:hypothetical protein
MVVAGDVEQVDQLVGGDAAHGVEILERCEVGGLEMSKIQTCREERTLDALPRYTG